VSIVLETMVPAPVPLTVVGMEVHKLQSLVVRLTLESAI